jgi:hypothetical protein
MSWWDTGNDDDVIGDQPADIVGSTLSSIARDRDADGRGRPSIADLLEAVRTAAPAAVGDEPIPKIAADPPLPGEGRPDDELVETLRRALADVRTVYEERWNRPARFSELLETVAFVLRPDPAKYVSGTDTLHKLEPETNA